MADSKISALTEITTPATSDVLPIVNSATTKKVQIANIQAAGATGTGGNVLANTPTLITPVLGVAGATSLATSAASPLLLTNGKLVTIALTSQTVNPTTLTIPDFASVADTFTFNTLAATLLNKTLDTSVGKGTWTASGTWTLPAFTLGGTIAGGGNQLNNIIIGTSTPLAGTFTTLVGTTVNGLTITNNGTNTLNIAAGKSFVVNNGLTLGGTDSTTMTFPSTSATIARTDAGNAFIGNQTIAVGQTTSAQTDLLINPTTKASGNLIQASVNNVVKFSVDFAGVVNGGNATFGMLGGTVVSASSGFSNAAGGYYTWAGRSNIVSGSDGVIAIQNNAQTDFSRLQFGGTTSSFPALKRSSTTLAVRLADDSADAPFSASNGTLSGTLTTPIIKPASNSSTAVQITQADGSTGVVVVDTSAKRVGINGTPAATLDVEVSATGAGATLAALFYGNDSGTGRGLRVYGVGSGSSGDDGLGLSPNTSLNFYIWDSSGPGSANRNMTIANTGLITLPKTGGGLTIAGTTTAVNIVTTATSSTGTAVILDGSNVLRPLTSSVRFKKDIQPWHPSDSQMNAFLSLEPISYRYRENDVGEIVGFSAETLASVDRELVNLDKDGLPFSNREHAMLAYLHEIVKKQQQELNALKRRRRTRSL